MSWFIVGLLLGALGALVVAALAAAAGRDHPDDLDEPDPTLSAYVDAMTLLIREHVERTGHSFGEGTAEPDTCATCRFLGGLS